jgi:hypothetical protein
MARRPSPLPAQLGESFTRAEALRAGVTPARLRAKDLDRPIHGVRVRKRSQRSVTEDRSPLAADRRARAELVLQAQAAARVLSTRAFFTGRTAAVLYGAPIAAGGELVVGVPAPMRSVRRTDIRGVKVAPHLVNVITHAGLAVASPASTWASLAGELNVRELIIVGDALDRIPRTTGGRADPGAQLATIQHLRAAIDAGKRPGIAQLREAIPHIRVGSASPLETEYRLDAAAARLPEPQLDVEICDASGRFIGITEIVYREYRVLVEVEGDHHRTSPTQWDRDIEKYGAYVAAGWEVVRLTSRHIRGAHPRAVQIVGESLRRHGWRP